MRRANAFISMLILALFLFHGIMGGFQLAGVIPGGSGLMKVMAWIMTVLIAVHGIIGIKLTADTFRTIKKSGAGYYKENRLFWLRRASGFAIMVFILFHILIFLGKNGDAYRLSLFAVPQLISQILLVISVALHVITNVRPMLLSFGTKSWKDLGLDLCMILAGAMLFTGVCFIVYYIRWKVF